MTKTKISTSDLYKPRNKGKGKSKKKLNKSEKLSTKPYRSQGR